MWVNVSDINNQTPINYIVNVIIYIPETNSFITRLCHSVDVPSQEDLVRSQAFVYCVAMGLDIQEEEERVREAITNLEIISVAIIDEVEKIDPFYSQLDPLTTQLAPEDISKLSAENLLSYRDWIITLTSRYSGRTTDLDVAKKNVQLLGDEMAARMRQMGMVETPEPIKRTEE